MADNQPGANNAGADESPNNNGGGLQSPGKLLAAGRAARELSIEEVGDALNLSPQTVTWLETDKFDSLPAPAFTQGYIRNYAKHVGLDADAVVTAYQEKAGKPAVAWESPRGGAGIGELVQRHPGVLITAVVAAVVLLLVIVLAVVWPDDEAEDEPAIPGIEAPLTPGGLPALDGAEIDPAPDAAGLGPDAAAAARQATEPAVNAAERFDTPSSRAVTERDQIDPDDPLAHLPLAKTYIVDDNEPESASVQAPTSANTGGSSSATASAPGNYRLNVSRRLTPAGDDVVRLTVNEDCWVAIRDLDGKELFGRLGRPGQTMTLTGQGPFQVVLGYAEGVELFLNDSPILLTPYVRNSVASLVIGQ